MVILHNSARLLLRVFHHVYIQIIFLVAQNN